MKRVLVVGAGLAGLAAAYRLARRGLEVSLVEASPRVGGVIASAHHEGFIFEEGPNSLRVGPWLRALLAELDLEAAQRETLPTSRERAIWRHGKRHTLMGPKDLLGGTLLSGAGKRRLLAELLRPARQVKSGESVGAFLRERLGEEAMTGLVVPVFTGVFAASPDEVGFEAWPVLSALATKGTVLRALPGQMKGSRVPTITFDKGLAQLCETYHARFLALGGQCHLGQRLKGLTRLHKGLYQGQTEQGLKLEADAVILATPAFVSAPLLEGLGVESDSLRWLQTVPYASAAAVSLGIPEQAFVSARPQGFGTLIAPDSPLGEVLGLVFASNVFAQRAPEGQVTVTAIMGGTRFPQCLSRSDAALVTDAQEALRQLFPFEGEAKLSHVARHPKAIALLAPGHREAYQRLQTQLPPHLQVAGAWTLGAALPEVLRSGLVAADALYAQH